MIKNLLFDMGGVILNIERQRAIDALRQAGMPHPEDLLGDYGQKGPFLALEKGEITVDVFHDQLRPYFTRTVTDEEIDEAFCRFLVGIPVERLRAIEQLKKQGYKIYLLSNTNALMWDRYVLGEFRKDGHDIDYYMDGIIASFQVKAYKPDAAIFEAAERILGIKPEETLFFDDSETNIEAAAALGFNTALVTPERGLIEYMNLK